MAESIEFRGDVYRRWPDSPHRTDRVYFTATGGKRLHRAIWEVANGPVPPACDIHHIDGDPSNNDLANLSCLPESAHHALHAEAMGDDERERRRRRIESIRPLAAEWHGSEAGREWHREHGRQTWVGREARPGTCEHCGGAFETKDRKRATRFCSSKCRSYARKASGVDDVQRTCPVCDSVFTINRYAVGLTCSRVCGQRLRRDAERSGVRPDG